MKSLIFSLFVASLHTLPVEKGSLGGHKLTMQEAERILGESCQLTDSKTALEHGGHTYKCTYLANSSREPSGKAVALYFVFESYGHEADTQKTFETMKVSNQTHDGFETLTNLGDEAFLHSDQQNFYLILVRKDNELVRLKVSKITSKTSLSELKNVANAVVMRM